ncbi:carbohydrate binding domain-containing protein [candidate division KSB1 bacterium]|nr:carbohydrate binding domain-containing protein [candidate division KSB1 bacterium]
MQIIIQKRQSKNQEYGKTFMIFRKTRIMCIAFSCFICAFNFSKVESQTRQLVWSDEFNGPSFDQSIWSFQLGQFNDCVHYCTDRPANTKIVDGKLLLIALKESYLGYNYTASVIKTKHAVYWRYGRIEARIKLPGSNGFVPAFWLLPEDERYGWWPASGEIDVIEHPTTEINKIYGTVHTEEYNAFTGSGPRGGTIVIPDAESAFHIYAVEWTPDEIDFFVDETKYFTFNNDHAGFQTWPFDQPFYIILDLAVGGGWVGNPTASTVFPAIMEVDYVRVFQNSEDIAILGPDYVVPFEKTLSYSTPVLDETDYEWSVPNTAHVVSGENSPRINVDWGIFPGTIEVLLTQPDGSRLLKYPVQVDNNLLKNADFEKGSKYWNTTAAYPAAADFTISTQDAYSGNRSVFVDVKNTGVNAWDIQLSQSHLALKEGQKYDFSFQAKSKTNSAVTAAIINETNFNLYGSQTFQLTDTWMLYTFSFVSTANAPGSFNIDMGDHTGAYFFDAFRIIIPSVTTNNQVKNADFSAGDSEWTLNSFSPAIAAGSVIEGEYAATITNGGVNIWDVHVGQAGFTIEKGKEYTLSFDAYAAAPREIFPLVGKNSDPWTVYNDNENVQLSIHRRTYAFSFTMQEPTDPQARLGFDIGASSDDVFLDNVFIGEGDWPLNVVETASIAKSFELHQNWPNPFNPITIIEFELDQACFASLKIYNINGKLIKTVFEKESASGIHRVQWDCRENSSGVYISKLTVNGMSQINKMTLIK